jgi:hypothetical protein
MPSRAIKPIVETLHQMKQLVTKIVLGFWVLAVVILGFLDEPLYHPF